MANLGWLIAAHTVDPGFGRNVAMLDEQVRQLAENVIGVQWNHEQGCSESTSSETLYN